MNRAWALFKSHPYISNVVGYTTLFATADLIQQSTMGKAQDKGTTYKLDQVGQDTSNTSTEGFTMAEEAKTDDDSKKSDSEGNIKAFPVQHASQLHSIDWAQTARVAMVGFCFHANFNYHWLRALERMFPGGGTRRVSIKVFLDQLFAAPMTISAFYIGLSTLEGAEDPLEDWRNKFWTSYKGIDIRHNKDRKVHRKEPKSQDIYLRLLVKLYRFLSRRCNAPFNKVILRRLFMSKTNRPPMALSRLVRKMKLPGRENLTAVVVGTITDDVRIQKIPKLKVCALKLTDRARTRILKAGGEIMTFDQLALTAPRGKGTVLLSGPRKAREVYRHFGKAPGTPHSHTKPYVRSKGRKFERARGRRASRGYKN
ncbi:60S ribosomal L18 [Labeo rohita]|uniref:60S ribosomal L18 n=2 Tax=Euteleostomi TaxID=117571 RepID=A0A498NPB6_LABRO|nr:60S ribosomal L18 [Labeo rohita]RXN33387.1 60S ribosomal L18 [Labeo rohita]